MRIAIFASLFAFAASTITFRKHIYVEEKKTWYEAQRFCRNNYTDLSPLSPEWGEEPLRVATADLVDGPFWIGLYRNQSEWRWSGAGPAEDMTWDQNEPSGNQYRPAVACWDCGWDGLHDFWHSARIPFFCVRLEVAAERRLSWERALEHCARQDSALASISSQTEQLLAETEVQQSGVGGPVWIGLRFLVDRWLWVDGSELRFVAWAGIERGDRCPVLKRCGALSEQGLWENRDCAEEHHFICN